MKLFTEAFLDRWEARATAGPDLWQTKAESNMKWLAMVIHSDLRMRPTERYSLRRYLRQIIFTGLPVIFLIILVRLLPLAYSWWKYPFVFANPRYHKVFIGLLSHEGYYLTPWMLLLLLTVNCLLYLPRFYFWNRRATRLRREPPLPDMPTEAVAVDTGIWPPAPRKPAA